MSAFTKEDLKNLFIKKAEELQKVPSSTEINEDPKLPNYPVFKAAFGNLRKCKELKTIVEKYTAINKINRQFCRDCVETPDNCENEISMCKEDAELYFTLKDKII
ncbi:hypothetical protein [Halanaerobium sp.]|uniref:hypothetical protein n=1 Tax=Halanaerobium sp. TaxID=1895664 RepID=UPI000DE65522|nr:hypothetical protein [Halanaerobium sp.]PUU86906.1 MAG: S-layer protein [Halanaerobium sp.]